MLGLSSEDLAASPLDFFAAGGGFSSLRVLFSFEFSSAQIKKKKYKKILLKILYKNLRSDIHLVILFFLKTKK